MIVERAMDGKIHDHPSEVTAEDGVVIVDGPDAVAVSLTAEAAEETSERLLLGSLAARQQQKEREKGAGRSG